MRLPPRPDLVWRDDGTPLNARVGDVYFSREDGLAESRAVFLAGCGLPDAWRGKDQFTIAELGFGTGLNFLATWQMWRANRPTGGWLNFVSFEGYPLAREDAKRALSLWPELAELSAMLLHKWPVRAKGVRRVVWPEERLSLTLHIGEIIDTLQQSSLIADAWFLDGFSPAKNGAMWEDRLWPLVAERCVQGARIATFTAAGAVRRGLDAAGFSVVKLPGHGRKRHKLAAQYRRNSAANLLDERRIGAWSRSLKKIAIIGAGIAGASAAQAVLVRGAEVTVFDQASGPAQGTSGNPLALVMPRLDAGDAVDGRLVLDAYLTAQNTYDRLPGVETVTVTHRPRDEKEAGRFAKMLSDPPLGLEQLEAIADGVLHKRAMILRPPLLLPALLDGADLRWGQAISLDLMARTVSGEVFDAIILANGWAMHEMFPWLRLEGRAGQIEWLTSKLDAPPSATVRSHYALASGYDRLWGATFGEHRGDPTQTSAAARTENAAALAQLNPYWQQEAARSNVQSRAGIRASTPDRLPVIGRLIDAPAARQIHAGLKDGVAVDEPAPEIDGIYLAGGFGARGFTWGPWAGAILTAQMFGDPVPAALDAMKMVSPLRQILRDLKRGVS